MTTRQAIILGTLLCAAGTPGGADERKPRDLYLDYQPSHTNTSSTGMPGSKISIELNRDGKVSWVSPATTFRSGDRVRFHFAVNFSGYVGVLNVGSTGRIALLFPNAGASNRVQPTADYPVPRSGWIRFDENRGEETLTFVMSTKPIPELQQVAQTTSGAPSASQSATQTGGSFGGTASSSEAQEILAALNSRALKRVGGRDLKLEVDGEEGYVLTSQTSLDTVVAVTLKLAHR